ncbi:cyclophilin-like fold protein [Dialister invisus]|uniref:cyclophilin-like fold protein n=1 Tax=Dialister invisus TaxID=218538 RepID=UPI002677261E|nr:cyclophilin-like fold protein [Dialister invisus]
MKMERGYSMPHVKRSRIFFSCLLLACLLAGCSSQTPPVDSEAGTPQSTVSESSQLPASDSEVDANLTETLNENEADAGTTETAQENGQTLIRIEIGDMTFSGELDGSDLAQAFASLLPQTISMQRVGGGREFYGGIEGSLTYDEADAQTTFENGDIAYWFSGNGLCLLYDNQVEEPEVESGIIVIGKITSDFSELHNMDDTITATISLAN